MCVDFWVETASPIKNGLKSVFFDYAKEVYKKQGVIISSYFPSAMGGDMKPEDFLINMDIGETPENLLTMEFSEVSDKKFNEKYINSGVYKKIETVAWFPEVMVVDTKRLGDRPLPENYENLADPVYKGEVCIIGVPAIPDPLISLYFCNCFGMKKTHSFINNISGFGAPVNVIRHIGKTSNTFGSIFIIPLLFAEVCKDKKAAKIIIPETGILAEKFIYLSKNPESQKSKLISDFLHSKNFQQVMWEKRFPTVDFAKENGIAIDNYNSVFFENNTNITKIYSLLRKHFSNS